MKPFWLSSTALATCHRTGFLNPHALKNMLRFVIGAYFETVVKARLDSNQHQRSQIPLS